MDSTLHNTAQYYGDNIIRVFIHYHNRGHANNRGFFRFSLWSEFK